MLIRSLVESAVAVTSVSRSAAVVLVRSAARACWATGFDVARDTSSDWIRASVAESWAWVWLGSIRAGRFDGRTSSVEVAVYCFCEAIAARECNREADGTP